MRIFNCIEISVHKKKLMIGAILGVLSFIILFLTRNVCIGETNIINGGYLVGVPFLLLFLLVGAVRLRTDRKGLHFAICLLWSIGAAVASIFWAMTAVEAIAIWRMPVFNLCLNIALFFAFSGFACIFFANWRKSVNLTLILNFIVAIANSYVSQFRGREILYSDLASAKTAMMVVGEYTPQFSFRMALGLSLWVLIFFSQFSFDDYPVIKKGRSRMVSAITALCLSVMVLLGSQGLNTRTWGGQGSSVNGFYINFILSARDAKIEMPEEYSALKVADIEQDYTLNSESIISEDAPDVIVIMNESFADLHVLGDNFQTNEPVMPFWDSLQENTVKGYALTSVYGGSTANAEFEFLTGMTMGFLPAGSTPYQQYLSKETTSLAWLFRSYGYTTWATHPYYKNGWARNTVYPLIGFEESTFIDAYPQKQMVRYWVGDREMYEYLLEKLNASEDEPQFVFGVTMQNHGGYTYEGDDFQQSIQLAGYDKEYPWTEQYLSLVRESDKAIEYLLTELENRERDTVVLIFGDHLPGLESDYYDAVHGGAFVELEERMLKYKVPFVIWANYDISEKWVECTSLNYLGRYLLEAAQVELPPYYQFLADLEEAIPSMNAMGYYSVSQRRFVPFDQATAEEQEWLNKYERVLYNNLFDRESTSYLLFDQYLVD